MAELEMSPVALVQNPAFGSLLLWNFGRGYQAEDVGGLPLLTSFFLTLPPGASRVDYARHQVDQPKAPG
jgi:hypothetical protein